MSIEINYHCLFYAFNMIECKLMDIGEREEREGGREGGREGERERGREGERERGREGREREREREDF